MERIDIHTHILPSKWPDWSKKFGYGGFIHLEHHGPGCARMMRDSEFFREVDANLWDPGIRMNEMDRSGVTAQVLSTVPVMFNYWAKPDDNHDVSRFLNDHIASVVQAAPDRFFGLGTLPMQDPGLAIEELGRCVGTLGLSGIEIGSHVGEWNLSAHELYPVFEAASELGAAIFIHPWDMMGMDRMPEYWLPWLVGMPAETSQAICSVIFSGLLDKLPNLRIAFAHGGGSFPGTLGRIDHGYAVRPDLCAQDCAHAPSSYTSKIYVDSLVHDAYALRQLIRIFGSSNIALGSDYPFPLGEALPGALIESMRDLSSEVRDDLLFRSAKRWLGVS